MDRLIRFSFTDQEQIMKHSHTEIELFYVLEGTVKVTVEERIVKMGENDFLLINTGKIHSISGEGDILAGYLHINYQMICEYLRSRYVFFDCDSMGDYTEGHEEIHRIIKKIFMQYQLNEGIYEIYLESLYYKLLFVLIKYFQIFQDYPKYKKISGEEGEHRADLIAGYIESGYKHRLSLTEVADQCFLSNTYFSKYMKKQFGMSFVEYVNEIRLLHAVEDMESTDKSLTRVAMDNGFANTAVFNRTFKKKYSILPSEYRKERRREPEEDVSKLGEKLQEKIRHCIEQMPTYESGSEHKRVIDADVRNKYPLSMADQIMNIGAAKDLLNFNIQEQVSVLKEKLDFKYARFWGLYAEELYLIQTDDEGRIKTLNFNKMDRVMDFLIHNQICPFIEIGMKPLQIIKTLDEYVMFQESRNPFKNADEYAEFVKEFLLHYINRYGEENVKNWYFEIWYDWKNMNISQYWEYFERTKAHASACLPSIRLGGGGI